MWEAIRVNKFNSVALVIVLAVLLAALGGAVGGFFFSENPADGIFWGVLIATVVWMVMMVTALIGGDKILLNTVGAREVTHTLAPQLFNVVEEMKIASGLPVMPKMYLIDEDVPNAFAVGLKPERAAVAVTTGLLARLNRDELQGVVAHEIGHIVNRDILFMTLVSITVGTMVILSDLFWRSLWYRGRSSRRMSANAGKSTGLLLAISVVVAILAPIFAQLLYFACSRQREYLADASAAKFTRYPEGLASALENIANHQGEKVHASRTHAPLYIVNPMSALKKRAGLFSTHPPTSERVRILREMDGGSAWHNYEEAYRKLHQGEQLIDNMSLSHDEPQPIREAGDTKTSSTQKGWRDAQDILHKMAGYGMIMCACGITIKVPAEYDREDIDCPKCGTTHRTPGSAQSNASETVPAHP